MNKVDAVRCRLYFLSPFLVWQFSTYHCSLKLSPFGKTSSEVLYLGTQKQPKKGQEHVGHHMFHHKRTGASKC